MPKKKKKNPEKKEAYKTYSVWFPPELVERLDAYCTQQDRSRSWVIRKSVNEFLERKK